MWGGAGPVPSPSSVLPESPSPQGTRTRARTSGEAGKRRGEVGRRGRDTKREGVGNPGTGERRGPEVGEKRDKGARREARGNGKREGKRQTGNGKRENEGKGTRGDRVASCVLDSR
ncbi:hypothetical protein AB1N83_012055 [Pleurotus pulmonarius]